MADIDQLVARPITRNLEGGNPIPQRLLELARRSENEFANGRMQPVGTDHEIEMRGTPRSKLTWTPELSCSMAEILSPKMVSTRSSMLR